jgi:hypothetical protein
MRQRKRLVGLLTVAYLLAWQPCYASPGSPDAQDAAQLEGSLKIMDKNPSLADQQLRKIDTPAAKVFRAFLYFTEKVPIANRSAAVDTLMNGAIQQVEDKGSLGPVDSSTKYHYTDLTTLLTHLRFITDAAGPGTSIPTSIFRYYPIAAFKAFEPYWGSTRDGWFSVEPYPKYDVKKLLPDVAAFVHLLDELMGEDSGQCSGTMRYMYGRKQVLADMKASLGPTMFLPGVKGASDSYDADLKDFMEVWSNQQLWNKEKHKQYILLKGRAHAALADYYARRLQIDKTRASECAKNAIETISAGYLSEYSHSTMKETRERPIYKACTRTGVTAVDLEKALTGVELSQDDLKDGLRYCILNGGDVSAINWLISKGAPVTGGLEPPLFTAVCRPDVVDLLIKAGADPAQSNQIGKTALFQAVQFDSLESVKRLVSASVKVSQVLIPVDSDAAAEVNSSCTYNYYVGSRTLLHYAAMFASYPLIRYLVDQGVDVHAKDSSGATAESMISENEKLSKSERESLKRLFASAK